MRKDKRYVSILKVQITYHKNVCCNHTAVEQRCKIEEKRQFVACLKVFSRNNVSGHCNNVERNKRSYRNKYYCNLIAVENLLGLRKQKLVRIKRQFFDKHRVSARYNRRFARERAGQNHYKRHESQKSKNCNKNSAYGVNRNRVCAYFNFILMRI